MQYIPSSQVKEQNILYDAKKSTWVLDDGLLEEILVKYLPPHLGDALDIGSGQGAVFRHLWSSADRLYGIDLNCNLSEDIKSRIAFSSVDLNFEKLPYSDNSMDLITAFQIIEHLENPFLVMREAHRVLKNGGLFIVSTPNPFQITFRFKFLLTGNMPPWTLANDHLLFLTKDVFKKTYLDKFTLLETIYQMGAIPLWGRLRILFGKKRIKKHAMVLPRSEWFGRRVCYVLKKI